MGKVQQRVLIVALCGGWPAGAAKFYPDDPLEATPRPAAVGKLAPRTLSSYRDFFQSTFLHRGEMHPKATPVPALAVNTLGEVPDSGWYRNRHGRKRMPAEELARGPARDNPPSMDAPWKVLAARGGLAPGFTIEDSRGRRYLIKLDPRSNPEMATASDVVGSKFFHALGYHTPENYLVSFDRSQLRLAEGVMTGPTGQQRHMREGDLTQMLREAAKDKEGRYRAMASLFFTGELLGPFRYSGTRRDDPNDVVPHEHRRELRGLYIFAAWLGHTDITSLNTMDVLVDEGGVRHVQHHLIDFDSILG
ncbi:MAG: hypothetical protein ACRD96_19680, partial [Bryobacteraceae bacterium]